MKAAEALSAAELSEAQTEHYDLDDKVRRNLGKLSIVQKREIATTIEEMANSGESR